MRNNTTEYDELVDHALWAEEFEATVFSTLIEHDDFARYREELEQFYRSSLAKRRALESLVSATGCPRLTEQITNLADEYLVCIRALTWTDFVTTALNFSQAALHRLHQLRIIAPEQAHQVIDTLIEHEGILQAAAHISMNDRHLPLPARTGVFPRRPGHALGVAVPARLGASPWRPTHSAPPATPGGGRRRHHQDVEAPAHLHGVDNRGRP